MPAQSRQMAKPLCSSLDVVPKTRAWPHQVMVARSPAEKAAAKLLVELKSSRANIIGNVRPLKPDRFLVCASATRFAPPALNRWKIRKANELQTRPMVSDLCVRGSTTTPQLSNGANLSRSSPQALDDAALRP